MKPQVETQNLDNQLGENTQFDLFDILSGVSLVGGVVGSFFGNAAFAALPISFSLALQIANRRKVTVEMAQAHQTAVQQITEQINHNQATLLSETKQTINSRNQDLQSQLNHLSNKFHSTQQSLDDLIIEKDRLDRLTQSLESQQKQIEGVVKNLQEIENASQLIRSNSSSAEAYYQRGLNHQKLGNKTGAIEDYTEALHIDSTYPQAYHSRGIILAELGSKRQAVEDLRLAAKYYFEQGEIESYEQARNLAKEFYDVRHSSQKTGKAEQTMTKDTNSQVNVNMISVGGLFDDNSDDEGTTILG